MTEMKTHYWKVKRENCNSGLSTIALLTIPQTSQVAWPVARATSLYSLPNPNISQIFLPLQLFHLTVVSSELIVLILFPV